MDRNRNDLITSPPHRQNCIKVVEMEIHPKKYSMRSFWMHLFVLAVLVLLRCFLHHALSCNAETRIYLGLDGVAFRSTSSTVRRQLAEDA